MDKNILSNNEAADFLGVSPTTLPRWRWANQGPRFVRLGRIVKYRREDLQAFIDGNLVETKAGRG
jgi:predicted DNA-binding transcriptional regulator AlpA